jgi:hypothetical protein
MNGQTVLGARAGVTSGLLSIFVCATLLGSTPGTAGAHGADANTADVRLAGDTAYVVVWPPSEAFARFDDDGDGSIQASETRAHRDAMLELFRENFSLVDQDGRTGETVFEDLSTPGAHGAGVAVGAEHLRVTLRLRWASPPAWLSLRYSLVASRPMLVRSSRVTSARAVSEQRLLAPPELAVFDRDHELRRLLVPASRAAEP